jgi:hypothetical protein
MGRRAGIILAVLALAAPAAACGGSSSGGGATTLSSGQMQEWQAARKAGQRVAAGFQQRYRKCQAKHGGADLAGFATCVRPQYEQLFKPAVARYEKELRKLESSLGAGRCRSLIASYRRSFGGQSQAIEAFLTDAGAGQVNEVLADVKTLQKANAKTDATRKSAQAACRG